MVESVGKRLRQARLRKEVTVDQAAHATKVRPERIVDLENDDYTNFPSMTYAKGFLLIYARFLAVDVAEDLGEWENVSPVSMEDYEYLSNAPERVVPQVRNAPASGPIWPYLLVFVILAGAAGSAYFVMTLKRLGAADPVPPPAVQSASPPNSPAAAFRNGAPARPSAQEFAAAAPSATAPTEAPDRSPGGVSAAIPAPDAGMLPTPPASPTDQAVTLRPLKKTWVKVRQDVPDSSPVFEDWLFPDARALTFRGRKFWIEVGDAGGVEILKNGAAMPLQGQFVTIE